MKTQRQKVLELLKIAGRQGINSFSERATALQLPTRIFELKKEGYLITTRRHSDASVDYILLGHTSPKKAIEVEEEYTYVFEDNMSRRVLKSSLKPTQQNLW